MKLATIFSTMLIASIMASCTASYFIPKHHITCDNGTAKEKVEQIKLILRDNGFILQTDENEIEQYKYFYAISKDSVYRWRINLEPKRIKALCSGKETKHSEYYDDNTDKQIRSYWNVRTALEQVCDNKPYLSAQQVHDSIPQHYEKPYAITR